MNSSKLFSIAFSMLSVCSSIGFAQVEEASTGTSDSTSTTVLTDIINLLIPTDEASPSIALNTKEKVTFNAYLKNPESNNYAGLSTANRNSLDRTIALHSSDFKQSDLDAYWKGRQLTAGFTTDDSRRLAAAVADIRGGKELTPGQVRDLRNFSPLIAANPSIFVNDLPFITSYVVLNQGRGPNQFNASDLNNFRTSSRDAAGITSKEATMLTAIANKKGTALSKEEVAVLLNFMNRSPLGSTHALPSGLTVDLNSKINANVGNFPRSSVNLFKKFYALNQAIQEFTNPRNAGSPGSRNFQEQENKGRSGWEDRTNSRTRNIGSDRG